MLAFAIAFGIISLLAFLATLSIGVYWVIVQMRRTERALASQRVDPEPAQT